MGWIDIIKPLSIVLSSAINKSQQLWARYLEGGRTSTKIGSGRVEMEIGLAIPTFSSRLWDGKSQPDPTFKKSRDGPQ